MAQQTIEQLAEAVGTPLPRLLDQIEEAGLPQRSSEDAINDADRVRLLAHLKESHGEETISPKKVTLKRRTTSTLKAGGSSGRGRTVNVEVRKKRIYVRKGADGEELPQEQEDALSQPSVLLDDAERKRQEAARRRVEREEEKAREQEALAKQQEEAKKPPKPSKAKKEPEVIPDEPATGKETKSRKDKRDRHDLDTEDLQQKKSKHGNRKRRVQELIGEDLLGLDEIDAPLDELLDEDAILEVDAEVAEATDAEADAEAAAEGAAAESDTTTAKSKKPAAKSAAKPAAKSKPKAKSKKSSAKSKETAAPLGLSSPRPKRVAKPKRQHTFKAPTEEIKREVELAASITVQQLSQKMSVKATDVIRTLANLGIMKTINESVDQDTASLVVEEFGHTVKLIAEDQLEKLLAEELTYKDKPAPRAPVVTVMGHVDHGKTSLLDYIRNAQVVSGEAGGITQHIGAYRVNTDHGEICFIDTPGHAAFTAMRARGANSTDIVILVVAADDGVMPQTEEAVLHARAAEVPIVVAVNKIDTEGADPDKVKNELAAKDVVPDDWGGDTQFVQVSASTGEGIGSLLEAVLLQAELLELNEVQDGPAQGLVIESELDKGKGPVVTLLVQKGTLKRGDIVVAGQQFGRIRALNDENGKPVQQAGPAMPVAVLGLDGTPDAGDAFMVAKDERRAREVADFRRNKLNVARLSSTASLDNLFDQFSDDAVRMLNVVVKADVRGSLEAIVAALGEIGNEEVKVNVVMQGVGAITESDANYALTAGAVIFGFNVRADNAARRVIEAEELDLRYYKVIYDLVDDVKAALVGMLPPEIREEIIGIAEVREVFESRKIGQIAGCMVVEGTVSRLKKIRVLRDNVVIYEGELESLRRFKDEVENVSNGTECGIGVKNYNDVKVGDQVEVFDTREVARDFS